MILLSIIGVLFRRIVTADRYQGQIEITDAFQQTAERSLIREYARKQRLILFHMGQRPTSKPIRPAFK